MNPILHHPNSEHQPHPRMKSSKKKLIFKLPEGLDLEGKKEGEELEVVGTVKIEPDGRGCFVKINGIELPGYKDGEPDEDQDDGAERSTSRFSDAAMSDESYT